MRVILIIAAALLPPLMMQAFNEAALRSARRADLREESLRDAREVSGEMRWVIGGVRNVLVTTATHPSIPSANAATCETMLQAVFRSIALLRAITLVGEDGRVTCSTDPADDGRRFADMVLVRLAAARGDLALGRFARAADGAPELPVAYPVRGLPGPGPVLIGVVDLGWLSARLAERGLPPGATVTIADHDGTVLAEAPDSVRIGQLLPAAERVALVGTGPHMRQHQSAAGGVQEVADIPPGGDLPDMLVSVGRSTDHAFAASDAASARGYALLGGGFITALTLAAWMARGTITRPVHAILATTARWQAGDVTARVAAADARSELGRIALGVNALLDAVTEGQAGLQERLAELRAVYDGAPVGLGYVDRHLCFVTVNARLAEINARPAAAHRGRPVREVLPETAWRIEPQLRRALAGVAIPPVEVVGEGESSPGTRRRLLVSYHPVIGRGGDVLGVVIAAQEVTALRHAQETLQVTLERANAELERRVAERTEQLEAEVREREAAQAQLQQSQKMELIGQLTGGVAHDFNNLLTAIIGNLELAAARSRDRPDLVRLLDGAMRSADRGAALTQRMLAFGRRQFLRFQPVAVPALLDGMAELIARSIGPTIRVSVQAPATLAPARADPNQVELVVLNLVVNARDAMPQGGTVSIIAAEETVTMPNPAGLPPGDYLRISVSDTGAGMDAHTLARAFEPFFTTKPVGRGSGLGLSMVQGVAAQSDGGVAISSDPGRGTTVTVWFPRAEAAAPEPAGPPPGSGSGAGAGAGGGGRSVLLVDDDTDVAAFAAICLDDAGYQVTLAHGGAEGLSLLQTAALPDLLIADLGMPGINGFQLAAAARRLYPDLAILITTGYTQEDADSTGTLDLPVLSKPFKAADLLGAVAALLPPVSRLADAG